MEQAKSKTLITKDYNPNAAAHLDDGIFGLPFSFEESSVIYLPIPWEATTSYGGGTAQGPQAILEASVQLDLFDLDVEKPYEAGLFCLPVPESIQDLNDATKILAQPIKDAGGCNSVDGPFAKQLQQVNQASAQLNQWVFEQTDKILNAKKIPALIGGDHSCPFGAFQAAEKHFGSYGILHFDAHSDTRDAYLGFEHSHASIIFNAANKIPGISKFVQVGIRDFCEQEVEFTTQQGKRFSVFYDRDIQTAKIKGESFHTIAEKIIADLPKQVWVTFDIDGLDPRYCPHTGTPVPGGLDYSEAIYILKLLATSGRTIIGFDVMEVTPDLNAPVDNAQAIHEWDANVGMRLIYKLSALALLSQGKRKGYPVPF
jgi:agmatinase